MQVVIQVTINYILLYLCFNGDEQEKVKFYNDYRDNLQVIDKIPSKIIIAKKLATSKKTKLYFGISTNLKKNIN